MPTECSQDSLDFASLGSRKVTAAFDGGAMTSNAARCFCAKPTGLSLFRGRLQPVFGMAAARTASSTASKRLWASASTASRLVTKT